MIDTTVRDRILDSFDFLCNDWGFVIIDSFSPYCDSKKDVVIYQNKETNIQIDISANRDIDNSNRLNIEIVKIRFGSPASYSDYDNCFDYLLLLELDNVQESSYFWGFGCSQIDLFQRAAKLLTKHKDLFTTIEWSEVELFEQLRLYSIKYNYDYKSYWKRDLKPYYKLFRDLIIEMFTKYGYKLSYDSIVLPVFARDSNNDRFEFSKSKNLISICQHDFRDAQERYSVYKNNKQIISFDVISDNSARKAANEIEKIIKK